MRPLTTLFKVLPLTLVSGLLAAAEPVGVTPFEKTKGAPEASAAAKPESPRGRPEFLKDHPELKEQMEKLKVMSPEERQAWIKEHPEAAEKIKAAMGALRAKNGGSAGEPNAGRIAEFAAAHPELKEVIEKLKAMSPEERQAWLKAHPEVAEKIEKAKAALRERGENLTPEEREKLKARFKERLDKLSPEEREAMLKKHPELKEKLGEAGK